MWLKPWTTGVILLCLKTAMEMAFAATTAMGPTLSSTTAPTTSSPRAVLLISNAPNHFVWAMAVPAHPSPNCPPRSQPPCPSPCIPIPFKANCTSTWPSPSHWIIPFKAPPAKWLPAVGYNTSKFQWPICPKACICCCWRRSRSVWPRLLWSNRLIEIECWKRELYSSLLFLAQISIKYWCFYLKILLGIKLLFFVYCQIRHGFKTKLDVFLMKCWIPDWSICFSIYLAVNWIASSISIFIFYKIFPWT